jgi:predicted dehydrogenase
MSNSYFYSRRRFLRDVSLGTAALSPALSTLAAVTTPQKKLGIALVGLGNYATYQLGPALQQTKDCYLAGLVTGTPAKGRLWAEKYNIPPGNVYSYENFDEIARNKNIDIVYIALPVALHKEFTIRAARAGKHVICEKPMAPSVRDCDEMISACRRANRMLSIGYGIHFEPFNKEMIRLGQQKVYGRVQEIEFGYGFRLGDDTDNWRLRKAMAGGGGLMDMGVYAIQSARVITGEEPLYVSATEEKSRPYLFREVDETIFFTMEFPGGAIAKGVSSYSKNLNFLKVKAEQGWFELNEPYRNGGIVGSTSDGSLYFDAVTNQQALQMDDFAQCIAAGRPACVPGEKGRKDIRVIEAIYRSLASGKRERV